MQQDGFGATPRGRGPCCFSFFTAVTPCEHRKGWVRASGPGEDTASSRASPELRTAIPSDAFGPLPKLPKKGAFRRSIS